MTKKHPAYLIYLLTFLLLLAGASLYVWHDEVASWFFAKNLKIENGLMSVSDGKSEEASLKILRDPRIKYLEKQVKIFNYYDLVKSQNLIMEQAPVTGPPSRTRVGNSNPFVKKVSR